MTADCQLFYGLGNGATDPVTGEPALAPKIRALGVTVPTIRAYTDQQAAASYIHTLPLDAKIFAVAISCGANGLATLIALCKARVFAGVYAIAPSIYCNSGQPPIGDNAPNFWVFNGYFWSWPFPGLSTYAPQRAIGSRAPAIVRRTSAYPHPCDSDPAVQSAILDNIKVRL